MWSKNGFGNNGDFQNNFNQDDFPPSPFESGPPAGQQYFPQLPFQQNIMHFAGGNSEGFPNKDFHPEVGLYNDGAFSQNQFVNVAASPFSAPPFNLPASNTPTPLRPITNISSRAAELKAQLLRGRERASSSTPPVSMAGQITKQHGAAEGSSSLRESPGTPATATEASEQDLNINELISQYAGPKLEAETEMKDSNNSFSTLPRLQRPSSLPEPSAKSQTPSLGSPTKVTKPNNGKMIGNSIGNGVNMKNLESRHASSGSMSEGEIVEDGAVKKSLLSTEPKGDKAIVNIINRDELPPRKSGDKQQLMAAQGRGPRDSSPRRALPSNLKPHEFRHVEDRRDDTDPRQDRRPYPSNYNSERRPYLSEPERSPYQRREMRDQAEDRHRSDVKSEKPEDTSRPNHKSNPPTLAELLPYDEDLREWLEITGYHNATYRTKILNRRRAIAALDAQRNQLLAEMEAEERGGVQAIPGVSIPSSAMLPPPIPNRVGDRAELASNSTPETQRDRVVSNKRPYSDFQDAHEESSAKITRSTDRGSRIKQEEDADYGRPRSSDYEPPRRRSFDERRDDRDPPRSRHDEGRGRGRGSSREREMSPSRMTYESRPAARTRVYEGEDDFHSRDRDEWEERDRDRDRTDRRPFEVRGGYRGRAFDPNYRSRGGRGGRGRGDFQNHVEPRSEPGAFGARIANGKPFKDARGFDRGGKGDTRYFIVKSFNEENVMKCIEDGVWTTQVQNGPLFKEAFETCKNVILVFSINKSRAFQGYARMESLPGSVEIPAWQRAINWESAGAFKVKWLVICATRFHRIGHLKNALNDNQAVLIGKDGQEIEENCGRGLIELIDEEVDQALAADWRYPKERQSWEE